MPDLFYLLVLMLSSSIFTVLVLAIASGGGKYQLRPGASVGAVILGIIGGMIGTAFVWSVLG